MRDGRDDVLHTASAVKNINTIVTTVTVWKGVSNEDDYSNNSPCGRSGSDGTRPLALHNLEKAPPPDDVCGTVRGQLVLVR